MKQKKIIVVGGGFGGVAAALRLAKKYLPGTKVVLISDKPHLEYHAALYRVVTGGSPLEVCIPLRDVFEGTGVEIIEDLISAADLKGRRLSGASGSKYAYDFLILALGSETAYFDIPGLSQLSFGFKSITESLRLKRHLHEMMRGRDVAAGHFVIIGGGASGVELAGDLAHYAETLAKKHGFDRSMITIDLIEAAPRLAPAMPEDFSEELRHRLHSLGVNIFLNRTVTKEDVEQVYLKDMQIKSDTVIWTAGVKPNKLYGEIKGFARDKKGRVVVDEFLHARGFDDVFVIGDGAATPFAGMAQTAMHNGRYAADTIAAALENRKAFPYEPKKPAYVIPAGPGWAAAIVGGVQIYGRLGWYLRRVADFKVYTQILPLRKAFIAFQDGKRLCESCPICDETNNY